MRLAALASAASIAALCYGSAASAPLTDSFAALPARASQVAQDNGAVDTSSVATRTEMRNVDFHVARDVVLRIRELRGVMRSVTAGDPVVFDDPRSFVFRVDFAEVALTMADLAHLMNDHVFKYRGSPLRGLRFSTAGSQLKQSGTLIKGVAIPFSMVASVSVTPDGWIRIHPTEIRILGVDGERLMKALDIHLSSLLDLSKARGVKVDRNDLLLDPEKILPPPAMEGRLTSIRVEDGRLVQTFGDSKTGAPAAIDHAPNGAARNFMAFRGGTLRFGKLLMLDADMRINDEDPRDPFDFSIVNYNDQLVAGYSKNRPDLGLDVFMPDLNDIRRVAQNAQTHSAKR